MTAPPVTLAVSVALVSVDAAVDAESVALGEVEVAESLRVCQSGKRLSRFLLTYLELSVLLALVALAI